MQITTPSTPETLSYAILASIAIEVALALILAVGGDGLGAVLVLALVAGSYYFVCSHLAVLVPAGRAAASGAVLLLVGALVEVVCGHPYCGFLFIIAAAALGFAFVLLLQGTVPAPVRFGSVAAIEALPAAEHLAMLAHLRDAGLLSAEEFSAKRDMIGSGA